MKADISVLTERHAGKIREWLALSPEKQGEFCPFYSPKTKSIAGKLCKICDALFPSSAPHFHYECPCIPHPVEYIRRRAKSFVKKYDERKKKR